MICTARYIYFKPGGKWYTEALGVMDSSFIGRRTMNEVMSWNGGHAPGLSSDGRSFITVCYPLDGDGIPFLINPEE